MKHHFLLIALLLFFTDPMFAAGDREEDPRPAKPDPPGVVYCDIEMLSVDFGAQGLAMGAGLILDWYPGGIVLHAKVGGSYLGTWTGFFPEFGLGIVLDSDYRLEDLTQAGAYRSSPTTITYWRSDYTGYALTLATLDLGVKLQAPFYKFHDEYDVDDGDTKIFGQEYAGLNEYGVWQYDKIYYLGYRNLAIKQQMFTVTEFIWYVHALVGIPDRKAKAWFKSSYPPSPREYTDPNTDPIYGGEIGFRWQFISADAGWYDGIFFRIGFRLGFEIGL